MPKVVHVITTGNFAGTERYVSDVARETAAHGWDVAIVGGHPVRMPATLPGEVRWLPGAATVESLRSLASLGRQDVCHAHMTIAEAVSILARPFHRASVVATRHFAAPRGSSAAGRLLARPIGARLARQIAISDFVAAHLEAPPDAVIRNGVPPSPLLWRRESRVVLVLQRLEREKDTLTALKAWKDSRLADQGWSLRVVGAGSERSLLEAWSAAEALPKTEFADWTPRVADEFAGAGLLLAPALAEPLGLAVLEAMAAGVPVVASAAGGHLETVGLVSGAPTFPDGDVEAAAAALRSLVPDSARAALSEVSRGVVASEFSVTRHVDRLLVEYEAANSS